MTIRAKGAAVFQVVSRSQGGETWHGTLPGSLDALELAKLVAARFEPSTLVEVRRPGGPPLRLRGRRRDAPGSGEGPSQLQVRRLRRDTRVALIVLALVLLYATVSS